MAYVYLLVIRGIETGYEGELIEGTSARAFASVDGMIDATRREIDERLDRLDLSRFPPDMISELQDNINDMLHARKIHDLGYEMGMCRDVFNVEVQHLTVEIEPAELVGEIVNNLNR